MSAELLLDNLDARDQVDDRLAEDVGEQRVLEIRPALPLAAPSDDLARNADDDRIGRDGFDHDGIGADAAVVADLDRA